MVFMPLSASVTKLNSSSRIVKLKIAEEFIFDCCCWPKVGVFLEIFELSNTIKSPYFKFWLSIGINSIIFEIPAGDADAMVVKSEHT